MSKGFLAALGSFLAIIVALLISIVPISNEVKSYAWLLLLLSCVAFVVVTYFQNRVPASRAGQAPEAIISSFRTAWPKLSESLRKDIAQSLESADEARFRSNPDHVFSTNIVHFPNTQLYYLHLKTIGQYDKDFDEVIRTYIDAAAILKRVKHEYNQLVYSYNNDPTQITSLGRKMQGALDDSRAKMRIAADKLEDIVLHRLKWKVDQYDNEISTNNWSLNG
jgi:hypothetical protein